MKTWEESGPRSYDGVYKTLHWAVVALVTIQYFTKLMPPNPSAGLSQHALNAWHLSVGPTILLLMLLRFGWRLTHRPPPPPADLAPALRVLSRATHWAFYALLIAVPVLGWISASGFGARPWLLGLVPLPPLAAQSKRLGEFVGGVHGVLAFVLLGVIALHVGGALHHALLRRDGVLQRMLPFGRPSPP